MDVKSCCEARSPKKQRWLFAAVLVLLGSAILCFLYLRQLPNPHKYTLLQNGMSEEDEVDPIV
jgi:hypothetical protein